MGASTAMEPRDWQIVKVRISCKGATQLLSILQTSLHCLIVQTKKEITHVVFFTESSKEKKERTVKPLRITERAIKNQSIYVMELLEESQ